MPWIGPLHFPKYAFRQGARGIEPRGVWVDEMAEMNERAVAGLFKDQHGDTWTIEGVKPFTEQKKVHPRQITCRYCGAQSGEKCTKWRRAKHNRKVKVARSSPHPDRVHDARIATDALNALTSR